MPERREHEWKKPDPADPQDGQVAPADEPGLPEGPLPGLPLSRDPLREPGPLPEERETPPLD